MEVTIKYLLIKKFMLLKQCYWNK